MFVCLCNAIRDREFAAAAKGATSVAETFRKCGRRPQCGKCLPDVASIIEAANTADDERQAIAAE